MDERTQKEFDAIVAKPVDELTETDRNFLRARRSYLDRHNARKFQDIIGSEPEEIPAPEPSPVVTAHIHPADLERMQKEEKKLEEEKEQEETTTTEEIVV